jgi:hypothetical protein
LMTLSFLSGAMASTTHYRWKQLLTSVSQICGTHTRLHGIIQCYLATLCSMKDMK